MTRLPINGFDKKGKAVRIDNKPMKKRSKRSNPILNGAKPGDNARFLTNNLELMGLPPIDHTDTAQVANRMTWYFTRCCELDTKPSVSGLSLALGITRETLYRWSRGINLKQNQEVTRKAYLLLESIWEDYMLNGKVHPATGIFLGKNHFGYKDETEVVVTPNNKLGDQSDIEQLSKRYIDETEVDND
jgi:hypothetical protein